MGLTLRNPFTFNREKVNKYNKAFLHLFGMSTASYDDKSITYIEKGYKINPIVYSVVNQISVKASSIPFYIKKIDNKQEKQKRDNLIKAVNYNPTPQQQIKRILLESKAFKEDYLDIPLEKPNPLQNWNEFVSLYETFMCTTGNAYIYLLSPSEGQNAGVPIAWYLLPSQLMEIHVKSNADTLDIESPVSHYTLTMGQQDIRFEEDKVIHIKYANPSFDEVGEHLYGVSPLRASLKNIESSNEALGLNIKTLKNGGAFGFIHSKGGGLLDDQAKAIKERVLEMDTDTRRMSNILATSGELGFTRMSLTADELKPFDYLRYDMKMICNSLGWDDKMIGNDDGSKYDNFGIAMRKGITNKIMPDLKLLEQAINTQILPKYKNYKNTVWEFDISELPEMQDDMAMMAGWIGTYIDKGIITRNEARIASKFVISDDVNMNEFTVQSDILTLAQSLDDLPTIGNDEGI